MSDLSFNQQQNFSFNMPKPGESIQKMFKSASNESKEQERSLKQEYYKAFSATSGQNPSEYGLQMLHKAFSNDPLSNQLLPDHQVSYASINEQKNAKPDYTGYHQYHLSIRDPAIQAPSNHFSHCNSQHEIAPIPDPFNVKFGLSKPDIFPNSRLSTHHFVTQRQSLSESDKSS